MKFTHLTFDCYGTLIDWRNGLESNLGELLRRKGLPSGTSVYPTYVKFEAEQEGQYKPYKAILKDTAISVANHFHLAISENEAGHFTESIPGWKPFQDTVASLQELGKRGYKRIILSNIDRNLLEETIHRNNLAIDSYVTAEDVGSYKPAVGHWNRFFEQYKVPKNATLHVAQSLYHDIVPCGRLGVATAWINRYGEEKPAQVEPMFRSPNLTRLLSMLE